MEFVHQKRKQILEKYERLKKKIWDWEQAVYKTEGRKPNRDDMKRAPREVQESYKNLVRLKKYLEELSKRDDSMPTVNHTPGKLFIPNQTHRKELQRSERQYLVRTPSVSARKTSQSSKSPLSKSFQFGGSNSEKIPASRKSTSNHKNSRDDSEKPKFSFKRLFNAAVEEEPKKKLENGRNLNLDVLKKEEQTEGQDEGAAAITTSSSSINCSEKLWPDEKKRVNLSRENCRSNGLFSSVPVVNENVPEPESVTVRALKSPKVKGMGLKMSTNKKLDFGWLSRLIDEDSQSSPSNSELAFTNVKQEKDLEEEDKHQPSESSKGDCPYIPAKSAIDTSGDSLALDGSDANISGSMEAMDVDVEEKAHPLVMNENTDSGIGIGININNSNSLFSSDELHKAVEEVLKEKPEGTSSISDASLLYSFSEEACLPSDPEDFSFEDTIPNLINLVSESIKIDDDSSKSTMMGENQNQLENSENRKRSAEFAFSPPSSPEKEQKKRKFFKSSRAERTSKFNYSTSAYKPPSPKKRITRSSKAQAPASISGPRTPKLKLNRVPATPGHENVWTSKVVHNATDFMEIQAEGDEKSDQDDKPKTKGRKKTVTKSKTKDKQEEKKEGQNFNGRNAVVDIFDEAQASIMPSGGKSRGARNKFARRKQSTLEGKMQNGKLDENFVRIDLKRKVFVRGHKKLSVVKMKRLEWKNRKLVQSQEKSLANFTCHKCGEKGHYSKFCNKDVVSEECAPPGEEDDCPLPTLEEAARMVYKDNRASSATYRVSLFQSTSQSLNQGPSSSNSEIQDPSNDDMLCAEEPEFTVPKLIETVDPFYNEETDAIDLEEEMNDGLKQFGYSSFRPGQKEAITRVLKGLSTLLILSTGSGKSLCYQLPAYLYAKKYPGALTLCISPLVSLMEDQIQGIPQFLNAACLHSNMTTKQKAVILEKVKSRKLNILLVSPEAVCGGLFGLLKGSSDTLPKIGFACIDEVHCVSQWSHNFRPSYLQLCKILREKLNVSTILGLTATATKTTAKSICEHLKIDPSTTIRGELIPPNLNLSVSRDVYKDEALLNLLMGSRFRDCDSIIIYCTRREECERIATLVRTKLQTIQMNKVIRTKSRARLSGNCEAYHAGMTGRRRKNVQEGFMSGDIRIVVATVAFGMGIDKSDIRAVIHYNMPSAFESYVQEIGRAGRDGKPAHCHLFLDNVKRSDLNELKRHVYANSVDRPTIRRLLRKVFRSCKCKTIERLRGNSHQNQNTGGSVPENDGGDKSYECQKPCEGHEVSFAIEKCVTDLDLPKENITTLLCYLELDENKWIEMLPLTYEKCKIQSYGGVRLLKNAASRCPPLAVAIALLKEKDQFQESDPYIEFNVIDVASTVGWNSGVVKKELKNLEWTGSQFDEKGNPTRFRKSGLLVEFSDLAYRVKSRGSLSDEDADKVLNTLHNRNVQQEQTQIYQLHRVYEALMSVSFPSINSLCDSFDEEKSNQLKNFIYEYFSEDCITISGEIPVTSENDVESEKVEELRRTIRNLIFSNRDTHFTTRAIARILQGISSPCFPADVWYRNREFWRKYLDLDFHFICRIAAECI